MVLQLSSIPSVELRCNGRRSPRCCSWENGGILFYFWTLCKLLCRTVTLCFCDQCTGAPFLQMRGVTVKRSWLRSVLR
ncbi:hypothetical protein GDO78_023269 [Eleutherodactylus coqui]|uniref:Uncharacterized protein n=1 Tax=Eleutherodactylus coqui TaxID=57060 RepID=A0A8J6B3U5_ELECQ|nr:hypothetical protein GDO78_023269 [Eleutherodactylus coqui]